jgi:chemotaxis protein CheC
MKDELDILKEVSTTAAAHGSIALSEILGRKINLFVPSIDIIPCKDIEKRISLENTVISLQSQILSGINGKIIFVLPEKYAYRLIDIYYQPKEELKKWGLFTEIGMSVIKEIGSVIISAYITALGFFLKKLIIPSLPVLINAPLVEVMKFATISYSNENYVLMIESKFEESQKDIQGNFWLVLTPQAVEEIKRACTQILKDLEEKQS